MNIDIEKYLKDKGLFKTVVEDYNPYIVADLMEMYAKKYHEDQLNNLSQHIVSKSFDAKDFEYSEFIKGKGREYFYVSNKIHYFVNGELVKILNQ